MGVSYGDSLSVSSHCVIVLSGSDTLASMKQFDDQRLNHIGDSLLLKYIENGYPFTRIDNQIIHTDSCMIVEFSVDSGKAVTSVILYPYSKDKGAPWLLYRPVGGKEFSYSQFSVESLDLQFRLQPYVENVTYSGFFDLADSNRIAFPLSVQLWRDLLFNGAVAWDSESDVLVGEADLSLVNLFSRGEVVGVSFFGDDRLQKVRGKTTVPYVRGLPFSVSLRGVFEVEKDEYGYLEGAGSFLFDVWRVWKLGTGATYRELSDTSGEAKRYVGGEFILNKLSLPFRRQVFDWQSEMSIGSGVELDNEQLPRGNIDLDFIWHVPLGRRWAILEEWRGAAIASEKPLSLHRAEKIRVGGTKTIRGYREDAFSFQGITYLKSEILFYFRDRGALFLFGDGGVGVWNYFSTKDAKNLFGYGAGVRIPSRKLLFSLVWARQLGEEIGPGRIHVSLEY